MSAMRSGVLVVVCVLLAAFCLASVAFAQTNWQRTYGGTSNDYGYSVQQTSDGGYIIAGHTSSFGAGGEDAYLVKTNAQGDTLWTRTYGGPYDDDGYSVQQTTDGGFIVAGYTRSFGAGTGDVYLIKTDSKGDTLWTRTYGGAFTDWGNSVQQTADGGYVIVGLTFSFGPGTPNWCNFYLIKTNASGDTLWTRTYGGPDGDDGSSVQQTTDGGYIVAGTGSFSAEWEVYLVRTNAQGDTLWTRAVGSPRAIYGRSVQQTTDGGYIIAGSGLSGAGGLDACLIKTNSSGDTVWTRTYGGPHDEEGYSVQLTTDGGFIVSGYTKSFGAGAMDVYLVKTDAQGDALWTRTYGGPGSDIGYSIQQTNDGGYIITGSAVPLGGGSADVYLVKINADPDVGPAAILSPPGTPESGRVYLPSAIVRNFGLTPAIFPVTMSIGSGYAQTVQETLASELSDTVVFPAWTAGPVGSLTVTCFTSLAGDEDPANDTIRDSIQVLPPPRHDVGTIGFKAPVFVRAGDSMIAWARVKNFGNTQERFFDVRFRIGASYNRSVNVADPLLPDSTVEVRFPPWVAEAGNWAVSCSTVLASDVDSTNDKASLSVQVFTQSLQIAPDRSDRLEAGKSKTYQFHALIQGDTGAVVEVARPSAPTDWSLRLGNATGATDLTDTDADGIPDLGYVAPGESSWFSLAVTAPSETQGDTSSLSQGVFVVAGHVADRPDIADTATLSLTLVPSFSVHNFPNPFSDQTTFVIGLPDGGKVSLTIYTRAGERVCRVLDAEDRPAGVHVVPWSGVNDNGRSIAPGTYEYLLDYVHAGNTERIHKRLVLSGQ
jgi:hypothetical protein